MGLMLGVNNLQILLLLYLINSLGPIVHICVMRFSDVTSSNVLWRFCMGRNGGTGGGVWMHLMGNSMTVFGLGSRKVC